MESNLVSANVPNFITVNLMAWLGILFVILVYQFIIRRKAGATHPANNSGGY